MVERAIEQDILIQEEEWGLHLRMKKGAVVNNSNVLSRIEPVINISKEKGKNRILVEATDVKRDVSVTKLFQAGELLQKLRTAGIKIAFVAPKYVNSPESKFMEYAGFNRGTYVRYFSNSAEALMWLKE